MTKPSISSAPNVFLRLYTKLLALVTVCYWTQFLIVTYVTAANAVHAQVDYLDTHHECLTNFPHEIFTFKDKLTAELSLLIR